jgi:hypothetical protein
VFVGVLANLPVGGSTFRDEFGLRKINAKYPAMQAVRSSTAIVRISHTCMDEFELLIYVTPFA